MINFVVVYCLSISLAVILIGLNLLLVYIHFRTNIHDSFVSCGSCVRHRPHEVSSDWQMQNLLVRFRMFTCFVMRLAFSDDSFKNSSCGLFWRCICLHLVALVKSPSFQPEFFLFSRLPLWLIQSCVRNASCPITKKATLNSLYKNRIFSNVTSRCLLPSKCLRSYYFISLVLARVTFLIARLLFKYSSDTFWKLQTFLISGVYLYFQVWL